MKNNGLPSKKEWDKIVDSAFSSESIHQFSEGYIKRRTGLQKGIIMDSSERKRIKENSQRKLKTGAVAGIAAAIALVPASVFTLNYLSGNKVPAVETGESVQEETTAETTAEITTETETEPFTEETTIPDEYASIVQTAKYQNYIYINYPDGGDMANETFTSQFEWLPDGLQRDSYDPVYGKFHNGYGGGMSPILMTVPESGIQERLDYSASFEQYETDDRVIMINYRAGYEEDAPHDEEYEPDKPAHINFGREVWIAFKGTKYVQMFFITDDISKDDARKIAENVQLVPTDEETAGEWFDRYAPDDTNIPEAEYAYEEPEKISVDSIKHNKIGDTIHFDYDARNYGNGEFFKMDITLNDAWLQDDFEGIETDACGEYTDFSDLIGSDGKIHNVRRIMQAGDGVNTIDYFVREEVQNVKVLVLDFTYTNTGDCYIGNNSPQDCINGRLMRNIDGYLNTCEFIPDNAEQSDYFEYAENSIWNINGMLSFSSPNKVGMANHIGLDAGESTDLKMAFLVDENFIGNLYLDVVCLEENDPMFDLCDIK